MKSNIDNWLISVVKNVRQYYINKAVKDIKYANYYLENAIDGAWNRDIVTTIALSSEKNAALYLEAVGSMRIPADAIFVKSDINPTEQNTKIDSIFKLASNHPDPEKFTVIFSQLSTIAATVESEMEEVLKSAEKTIDELRNSKQANSLMELVEDLVPLSNHTRAILDQSELLETEYVEESEKFSRDEKLEQPNSENSGNNIADVFIRELAKIRPAFVTSVFYRDTEQLFTALTNLPADEASGAAPSDLQSHHMRPSSDAAIQQSAPAVEFAKNFSENASYLRDWLSEQADEWNRQLNEVALSKRKVLDAVSARLSELSPDGREGVETGQSALQSGVHALSLIKSGNQIQITENQISNQEHNARVVLQAKQNQFLLALIGKPKAKFVAELEAAKSHLVSVFEKINNIEESISKERKELIRWMALPDDQHQPKALAEINPSVVKGFVQEELFSGSLERFIGNDGRVLISSPSRDKAGASGRFREWISDPDSINGQRPNYEFTNIGGRS